MKTKVLLRPRLKPAEDQSGNAGGFTLVEVLVVTPILLVMVLSMTSFLFTLYGQFIQKNAETNQQVESQAALFVMKEDMLYAAAFMSGTSAHINDPHRPAGDWRHDSNPNTLLIRVPAYSGNRNDPNREPIFRSPGGSNFCPPYVPAGIVKNYSRNFDNVIYFVDSGTLYRRTLLPNGTACGTDYLVQTCPAANATPTCPRDRIMVENVSDFAVTYYRPDNVVTTTPEQADRISVTLSMSQQVGGETIASSTTISLRRLGE